MRCLENRLLPLVIAHRGAPRWAPENTLSSFKKALELGADMIELDVRACATGEAVVFHDRKVDRITNGRGRIDHMSFRDIRKLKIRRSPSGPEGCERIPTLDEVLLHLLDSRVLLNIEIKGTRFWKTRIVQKVLKEIRHREALPRVIVTSPRLKVLTFLKRQEPSLPTGLILTVPYLYWLLELFLSPSLRPDLLLMHRFFAWSPLLKWAYRRYKVVIFTVNREEEMRRLIRLGVHGIITDEPERLREIRDEVLSPEN